MIDPELSMPRCRIRSVPSSRPNWSTHSSKKRPACWPSFAARARKTTPIVFGARRTRSSPTATPSAHRARRTGARTRAQGPGCRPGARHRRAGGAGSGVRACRRRVEGTAQWLSPARRLLIVDDNKVNRLLLSRSVQMQGHSAALAENGRVALEMLRREPFDLLLLDIEMPEMDGFAVLEQLKADPQLRDLPVIVTSSVEGLDNIVRCIGLGAEDYLPKPVNAGAAEGAHRRQPGEEAPARPAEGLVRRFATSEVAQDLQQSGFALGGKRVHASVMFSDIRGFTALVESQSPEETIELLNTYYTLMFDAINSQVASSTR